jgi:hypothetical protein
MKFPALLLALILPLAARADITDPAQPSSAVPGGFLDAVQILPPEYRQGLVKVSADDGKPNPETWYFLARNAVKANDVYALEVTNGALTLEKPSFDFRALLGKPTSISLPRIQIDSLGAWDIAATFSQSRGRQLGSVSYVLEQKGTSAAPVWSVWCYDPKGADIGEIQILATNGSIISSD